MPINGSNKHTGRLPLDSTDPVVDQEATLKSDQRHAASEWVTLQDFVRAASCVLL